MTEEAEKDLKTSRRTKCRIWLKAKLAYWINRCVEAEKLLAPVVKDPAKPGEQP